MKRITILLFMLTSFCSAFAQFGATLSGTVTNSAKQPVQGVTVSLLNTNYITTSDKNGAYSFSRVPRGKYVVHVSSVAFAAINKEVAITTQTQTFDIQLTETNNRLDEVVVTANKREEEVQKVPGSISTLSAKQVQDYKVWNLKDITAISPNLYSANPGDNRNVTGIRGIVTTSYDPAVTTYIDGVSQFSLDTYIPQLFDVERVEILRGPQGTLYGRNAMGGVINVITKQPSNEFGGFAEASVGNYGQQRYSIGLTGALIKDKLFFGVAGLYNGFNGFYTNLFNNTKLDKQHSFLGNYYLKYLANQKLSFILNVKNYANRNNGPFALAGSPGDALANPFKVDQNATTTMIDNIFNASLAANYAGRNFNFTSVSTYQENYRYYTKPIDGDFSSLDAVSVVNNYGPGFNKVKVGTQEFKFSSPASASNLKWTAGVYGFYRYSPTKTGNHFGDDGAIVNAPPDLSIISTNIERNYGAAVYGQVVYSFDPQWDLTAGLRYDYEHKKEEVKGELQPDGGDVQVIQNDTSSTAKFHAITPKVSLAYHVTDQNNLYASYSRGFRAGGISQLSSDPSQPPLFAFKPEHSDNYEIGSKNTFFNNRLRVNVALFYSLVNNVQVPTLDISDLLVVTKNAGKLSSKGAEVEVVTTLLKGLDVFYNFGYTHARYTSLVVPNSDSTSVNLKGNHQVYTPDVTSMLALQYAYPLSKVAKLVARGEWRYLGDQYFDLANQIEQKGYSTFNARLGVSTKWFDAFLWGSNLADKHYIDYAYDFGASHLGNPRTYGVTLSTRF